MQRLDRSIRPLAWTAGVDWFRFIVDRLTDVPRAEDKAAEIQTEDRQRGSNIKRWKFQGYTGWATDRLRYGVRSGRLLWECSGVTAADTMVRMGSFSGHCSRIDLQTTWSLSTGQRALGTSLLGSKLATIHHRPSPRTPTGLTQSSTGLWLGTVGRRTSRSYFRLYDKGVESKSAEPGKVWRLELEAKRSHSRALVCKYSQELTQPTWCARYLVQRWKSLGCLWPYEQYTDAPPDPAVVPKETPTAGRLALWLSTSVAPTIPRLLTVFTVAEVLEMLNLSAVAAPTGREHAQRVGPRDDRSRRTLLAV